MTSSKGITARRPPQRRGVTRRDVLLGGAGAGLSSIGVPSLLAACAAGDDEPQSPPPVRQARTLFFNLSHEDFRSTSHFIVAGGSRYELTKVSERPQVLAQARRDNAFLRAVPDEQVTHHAEGVALDDATTTLGFVGCNEDPATGTWSMSMIVQYLPASGAATTLARVRAGDPGVPLAHSAKRQLYGLGPAQTEQDLRDETVLVDSTDHARTLIGLHPDLVCFDAGGAHYIHETYIAANANTRFLGAVLRQLGPAAPQAAPNRKNATGWATLVPINQDDGTPFKNTRGLNQYLPDWHDSVDARVATGFGAIHKAVKNDAVLGADITAVAPPSDEMPAFVGKVWYRRDGLAAVDRSNDAPTAAALPIGFKKVHGDQGLFIDKPTGTLRGDERILVAFPLIQNWFLRMLGIWVEFFDPNGVVIPVSQLPADTIANATDIQKGLNTDRTLFIGILTPPYTVAGVPVAPGYVSPTFIMPKSAASAKFYLAGMGWTGSQADPLGIASVGALFTAVVNFGVVALFGLVGVSGLGPAIKNIAKAAAPLAVEVVAATSSAYTFRDSVPTPAQLLGLAGRIVQGFLAGSTGVGLPLLVKTIVAYVTAAQIADSAPVVGQIARAAAAVVSGIQLVQTIAEVGVSPKIYEFDLALTHDLAVDILPDPSDNQFPQVPAGYTLYYKLTYLFDDGTPHLLDTQIVADPSVQKIPVVLRGIPRGGLVNISVGFYARNSSTAAGQNDWCAGKGSTGLVDNNVDRAPDLPIEQFRIPIQNGTLYVHTRKTQLDAQGRHVWVDGATAPPFVPPPGGQQPGALGALRSIGVRQGTRTQQGYVGYAWQGYSRRLLDCTANAPGQLDQAANLNTDAGNGGANAQNGYATTPCALQGGATGGLKLAYSLLGSDAANFYLDTSTLRLRQVQLNPPAFSNPNGDQAFAQLNFDSTALLLHPAGHVVSINNANHKIETLRLPAAPMADADASKLLLARACSGQGSRPGLITSPVAAAVSPEGVLLVLESADGNNRIQAFDLGGTPLQYFKLQPTPYFLQLDATEGHRYLDLAVEFSGYLYVLAQDPATTTLRLDIYHPQQAGTQPVCTTRGVNAARLAVDFWRSVYTLNYEVLKLPGGAIPDVTEPSVSLWVPTPPAI